MYQKINTADTEESSPEIFAICDESINSFERVAAKRMKLNNTRRDLLEVNQAFIEATTAFKQAIQEQPSDHEFGRTVGSMV